MFLYYDNTNVSGYSIPIYDASSECLNSVWNQNINTKTSYANLYKFNAQGARSDALKELTYSRKAVDTCSQVQTNIDSQTKLMNCTRAEDENIPSVINGKTTFMDQATAGYCYGQKLGQLYSPSKLPGGSLMDNWFCCSPQSSGK